MHIKKFVMQVSKPVMQIKKVVMQVSKPVMQIKKIVMQIKKIVMQGSSPGEKRGRWVRVCECWGKWGR